ncbi:MAG: hypothetical protein N2689_17795 [Verrucomicrobiae bacterium]|nr:hypothetical protein [Verrucomicrobiae bacterium]
MFGTALQCKANAARQWKREAFREQRVVIGEHSVFRLDERNWSVARVTAPTEALGYWPTIGGALCGLLEFRVKDEEFETVKELIAVVEAAKLEILDAIKGGDFLRAAAPCCADFATNDADGDQTKGDEGHALLRRASRQTGGLDTANVAPTSSTEGCQP